MGLILATITFGLTLISCGVILMANGMTAAPSVQGISPIPSLLIGLSVTGLFVVIHYVGW